MKYFFQLIVAVLGLTISTRSAQIPAVYSPFHYLFPYSEHQQKDAAILSLESQLAEIRSVIAQLATKSGLPPIHIKLDQMVTKSDLEVIINKAVKGILSNLQTLATKFENATAVVEIGRMPESCADLKTIGYKTNGFFQIKGSKQIESVYCNFTASKTQDLEKWIGYADVKSAPVHFYVQKYNHFSITGIPVPFEVEKINDGNAMNLTSGIFTAPRSGIYFFSFTGLPDFPASTEVVYFEVSLYLNSNYIASGRVEDNLTNSFQRSPLTLQSTLNLKKGDQVWVEINDMSTGVLLHDGGGHYTHFTGFMLKEEVVASF